MKHRNNRDSNGSWEINMSDAKIDTYIAILSSFLVKLKFQSSSSFAFHVDDDLSRRLNPHCVMVLTTKRAQQMASSRESREAVTSQKGK